MIEPLSHGFLLGFSLVAIGTQNIFVLRQGLVKRHVLSVVLLFTIRLNFNIQRYIWHIIFVSPQFFWVKAYLFLLWLSGCLCMVVSELKVP